MLNKAFFLFFALTLIIPSSLLAQTAPDSQNKLKTVVYYFHGQTRCRTCKTIEAYTREALVTSFSANLENGSLELKVVNVDEPENEHYINDFQLTTRSVVVATFAGEKQQNWKTLNAVWDYVTEKPDFLAYIKREVSSSLGVKQ